MARHKPDDLLDAHAFFLVMEDHTRSFLRFREDKTKINQTRYPKAIRQKEWWRQFRQWEESLKVERLRRLGQHVGTCKECGSCIDVDETEAKRA